MNKFYGKNINEMTFGELTLLSVDIQLTSFERSGITNETLINQSLQIRESLMFKCLNDGGDYSRQRFVNEFNGTTPTGLEGGFDECELVGMLYLN
jgi:hypothetical protein